MILFKDSKKKKIGDGARLCDIFEYSISKDWRVDLEEENCLNYHI